MQKETLRCVFSKTHTTLLSILIAVALTVGLVSPSMIAFATEGEEAQVQAEEVIESQEILTDEEAEETLVPEDEILEATENIEEEGGVEGEENDQSDQNEAEEVTALDEMTPLATIPIDASSFPSAAFRTFVSTRFDANSDGFLDDGEISAVTSIITNYVNISDITGIGIFYNLETLQCVSNQLNSIDVSANTKLTTLYCSHNNLTTLDLSANTELLKLDCSGNELTALDLSANTKLTDLVFMINHLTSIDVSALTELEHLRFSNNDLTTLDLRNNKKLVEAYHAAYGETVYISAGMMQYKGCLAVPSHTGNLVIDLEGFYTENADGSKTVDLNTVLSPVMVAQITENSALYDPSTGIMTIPAGTATVEIAASSGNVYTFFANLGSLNAHTVTFISQGQAIDQVRVDSGSAVAKPAVNPVRDGYVFSGWFLDEAATIPFDFAQPVTADLTLYAGWSKPVVAPVATPVVTGGAPLAKTGDNAVLPFILISLALTAAAGTYAARKKSK